MSDYRIMDELDQEIDTLRAENAKLRERYETMLHAASSAEEKLEKAEAENTKLRGAVQYVLNNFANLSAGVVEGLKAALAQEKEAE